MHDGDAVLVFKPVRTLVFRLVRRLFRLFHGPYYRFLYGRRFPGSTALARAFHAFERRTGAGDAPLSREDWETQYGRGDWDFLENPDELARYAVIAALVRRLAPGGRVLDVGSGDGVLLDELSVGGYREYVGIDLSETAVERGRARNAPNARFVAANAETWRPEADDPGFDAVILNECVYYFEAPEQTVRSYLDLLTPDGVLIVSMFHSPRTAALRRTLSRFAPPREEIELRHRKGAWTISVHTASRP